MRSTFKKKNVATKLSVDLRLSMIERVKVLKPVAEDESTETSVERSQPVNFLIEANSTVVGRRLRYSNRVNLSQDSPIYRPIPIRSS